MTVNRRENSLDEIELRNDQVQWWSLGLGCMSTAGAGTPDALNCRTEEGKGESTPKPGHGLTVGLIPFGCQAESKPFVEDSCLIGHSTSSWQNKGSEWGVFDFSHPPLVLTLLHLVLSVAIGMSVGGGVRVRLAQQRRCVQIDHPRNH